MPIRPIDWIESVDGVKLTTIGGDEEVILYVEEEDLLRVRHRMSLSDFERFFAPIFAGADKPQDVTARDFRDILGQNPEAEREFIRRDIGYEDVIDYWEEHGVFDYNHSSSSSLD